MSENRKRDTRERNPNATPETNVTNTRTLLQRYHENSEPVAPRKSGRSTNNTKASDLEGQVKALEEVCRLQRELLDSSSANQHGPAASSNKKPRSTGKAAKPVRDDAHQSLELSRKEQLVTPTPSNSIVVHSPYYDPARRCCGIENLTNETRNKLKVIGARNSRTVYLRAVPPALTLGNLRALLDKAGNILRLRVVPPSNWYSSKQQWMYGFVEYDCDADAETLAMSGTLDVRNLVPPEYNGRVSPTVIRMEIAKGYIGNHFSDDASFHESCICQTGLDPISALRTVEEYALSTVRVPLELPEGMSEPDTVFTLKGEMPPYAAQHSTSKTTPSTLTAQKKPSVPSTPEVAVRVGGVHVSPMVPLPSPVVSRPAPTFEVQFDCEVANSGRLNMGIPIIGVSSSTPTLTATSIQPPISASPLPESPMPTTPQDVIAALRRMQVETATALQAAEDRATRQREQKKAAEQEGDDSSSECSSSRTCTTTLTCNTSSSGSGNSGSTVIGKDGQPLSRKAARGKLRKDRQLGKKIAALATAIVSSSSGDSHTSTAETSSSSSDTTMSSPATPHHQPAASPSSTTNFSELSEAQIEAELARKKQMAKKLESQLKALETAKAARASSIQVSDENAVVTTVVQAVIPLTRRQKAAQKRERRQLENLDDVDLSVPLFVPTPAPTLTPSTPTVRRTHTSAPPTPKTTAAALTPSPNVAKSVDDMVAAPVMSVRVGGKAAPFPVASKLHQHPSSPHHLDPSAESFVVKQGGSPHPPQPQGTLPPSAATATPFVSKSSPPPYLKFPITASPFVPAALSKDSSAEARMWAEKLHDRSFLKWLSQQPIHDQMRFYKSLNQLNHVPLDADTQPSGPAHQKQTQHTAHATPPTQPVATKAPVEVIQPSQRRISDRVRLLLEKQRGLAPGSIPPQPHTKSMLVPLRAKPLDEPATLAAPTSSSVDAEFDTNLAQDDDEGYDLMMANILNSLDESVLDTPSTEAPSFQAAIANLNEFFQQQKDDQRTDVDADDVGVIGAVSPPGGPGSCSNSSCGSQPTSAPQYADGETDDVQSGSSVAQETRAPKPVWGDTDENGTDDVNIDMMNFNELISECMRPDPVDRDAFDVPQTVSPAAHLASLSSAITTSSAAVTNVTKIHATLDAVFKGTDLATLDHSTVVIELCAPLKQYIATLRTPSGTTAVDMPSLIDASSSLLRAMKDVGSSLSLSLLEGTDSDDNASFGSYEASSEDDSDEHHHHGSGSNAPPKPIVCLEMIALEELRALVSAVNVCVSSSQDPLLGEEMINAGMEWLAEASSPKYLTNPSSYIVSATAELLEELNFPDADEESETFRRAGVVAGYVHVRHQQNLLQCSALAAQGLSHGASQKQLVGALKSQQLLLGNHHKRIKAVFSVAGVRCNRKDFDVLVRTAGSTAQLTTLERFLALLNDPNAPSSPIHRLFGVALPAMPLGSDAPIASLTQVLSEVESAVVATKDLIKRLNSTPSSGPMPPTARSLIPSITH